MPPRRGCAATSSSPPALALLLAAACVGFTPARGVLNWAPLDAWLLTANSSVSPTAPAYASMAVYVGNTTGVQYRRSLGLNLTTPFVVASASKWVSTTVIMSVMQQFTRRFNQTTTLGEWVTVPPPLAGVTLRQLLSFTSGMDARVNCSEGSDATGVVAATSDVNFTVCVDQLKAAYAGGLAYPAGTTFHYAGSHMHLAAAAAMAAYDNVRDSYSHTAWASLFGFYVRNPLGLSTITQYFPRNNPHIAGGLFITPDDYANWMQRYFAVRGAPDGLLQAVYIYATENPVVDSSTAIGFSPLSAAGTSWFYAQGACDARCGGGDGVTEHVGKSEVNKGGEQGKSEVKGGEQGKRRLKGASRGRVRLKGASRQGKGQCLALAQRPPLSPTSQRAHQHPHPLTLSWPQATGLSAARPLARATLWPTASARHRASGASTRTPTASR